MSEYLKKNKKNFRFLLSVYIIFQYQAKSRTSASEGMRHAFFNSLGPSVHRLPDSKYWQLFMKVTESPPPKSRIQAKYICFINSKFEESSGLVVVEC